ncbi:hypothetical protein CLOP_g2773 [Closterium sp. NIES-67]|nr:hypothetical protein CLOP_g2773 [Closterium sp. NIES-67]
MDGGMAAMGAGFRSGGGGGTDGGPLEITVTDPVKQGDGVNAYTSYRVTTKSPASDGEVYVIRRFSDFEWLHDRLGDLHRGAIVPPLPDKNVVEKFRFSREFVESRRRGLETFVRRVARHPVLGQAEELQHFLKDSEDRWTMEMRKTAESKLLGAKPSDFFSLFSSVQSTLASAVLGREDVTEEKETERLKRYADALEKALTDCHRDALQFVKKQRELGASMCEFGVALQSLGQWEEGPLGKCFSEVGNKADIVGSATRNNAQVFLENLEEPLKEYVRLVISLKKAISDRSLAWRNLNQLEADLKAKKGKLHRAQATSQKQEKIEEIEKEIADVTRKVEDARKEHADVAQRLGGELQRCHVEMAADFDRMFRDFRAVQVRIQRQTAHSWESLQPAIRAAGAALQQNQSQTAAAAQQAA